MPQDSPPSRRRRSDEEMWIRKYDRQYTIFDRLIMRPQLLLTLVSVCLALTIGLFAFAEWRADGRISDRDKRISLLEGQIASLKPKAESAEAKNKQLQLLQEKIDKLNKQMDSYKNCKCKPGKT